MRVWIDATHLRHDLGIFGMTLLERSLRSLVDTTAALQQLERAEGNLQELVSWQTPRLGVVEALRPTQVRIELGPSESAPAGLPKELVRQLPISWSQSEAPLATRLQQFLRESRKEPVIALSADCLIDGRLLEHMIVNPGSLAFQRGQGVDRASIARFEGPLPEGVAASNATDFTSIVEEAEAAGALRPMAEDRFDAYVSKLRRDMPPYLWRVTDAATRQRAERFLFWSNYKGSTDFMTKYVYPPLVWLLVRPLAKRRIHPNWVTSVGIVATFASVPFCATGAWVPGLALAYLMSILDSVDGKLARVTYTSSKQGDVLDHGTDIVHPPIWYFAWAWGLSGGDPFSPVFTASVWMAAFYIFDRIMEVLFKSCTGRSIHGYRPLDVRMRTFVSRRNVNLPIFTVGLLFGFAEQAFMFIVAWQGVTALYHFARVIQFWNALDVERAAARRNAIAASVADV